MSKRPPEVYAKRRETAGMFFKWILRFYYKDTPDCMCGWAMKPTQVRSEEDSWICIWKKCGWETYQSDNGKLHWFTKR